eukprot:scaffold130571_cov52-Cyclotella_meneghiniana.AAC.2
MAVSGCPIVNDVPGGTSDTLTQPIIRPPMISQYPLKIYSCLQVVHLHVSSTLLCSFYIIIYLFGSPSFDRIHQSSIANPNTYSHSQLYVESTFTPFELHSFDIKCYGLCPVQC